MVALLGSGSVPLATVDPRASAEAVEWFRKRVPVDASTWQQLSERAQRGAFRVARVFSLDVVTSVWRAIDSAVAAGTDFRTFKRTVAAELAKAWGAPNASRVATIFRTNVQTAYAAGRYSVATRPEIAAIRPWWRFDSILDGRVTTICEPRDGLIKRSGDAWWASNYPPLHYQCRSGVTTLTEAQAVADGYGRMPADSEPAAQSTFGAPPAPDAWSPNAADYPAAVWGAWSAHEASNPNPQPAAPAVPAAPITQGFAVDRRLEGNTVAERLAGVLGGAKQAEAFAKALDTLGAADPAKPYGKRATAAAATVRGGLRSLIEAVCGDLGNRAVEFGGTVDRYDVNDARLAAVNAAASYGGLSGTVTVKSDTMAGAARALRELIRHSAPAPLNSAEGIAQDSLHSLLHEETHGYSLNILPSGASLRIEECVTETIARRVGRALAGWSSDVRGTVFSRTPEVGTPSHYDHWIARTASDIGAAFGVQHARAVELIEDGGIRALAAPRTADGARSAVFDDYATGNAEQVRRFAMSAARLHVRATQPTLPDSELDSHAAPLAESLIANLNAGAQ